MDYFLILSLCTLATAKFVVHGAFGKRSVRTLTDAAFFYGLVFLVPTLVFGYSAFSAGGLTWALGGAFGVLSAVFQLCYTKALADGPVSVVGLIVNLAILLPVSFSVAAYGEPLGVWRIVGIFLLLASFIFVTDLPGLRSGRGGWLIYSTIAMAASGSCAVLQKIFAHTEAGGERAAFVGCAYIVAMLVSFAFFLVRRCGGDRITYKLDKRPLLTAAAVGGILSLFQVTNTYAVATVTGTFFFPAYYGGSIILFALAGALIFHDRLSRRALCGILLGAASVILVSL